MIEIVTAISALVIVWIATSRWMGLILGGLRSCLIIIAFVDIKNQTLHIPSRCIAILIQLLVMIQDRDMMIIWAGIYTLGVFGLIYRGAKHYAQYKYQMQEGFGQGDVMLAPILMMNVVRYQLHISMVVTQMMIWSNLIYFLLSASIMGLGGYVLSGSPRSHQTLAFLPYMILGYVFLMILQTAW